MELQFWVCRISSWCHLKRHCMSRHLVTLFCNITMWNSSSLHSTQYILYSSYEQAISCAVDFLNYCQINSITDTNMTRHIVWPKVCHHLTIIATCVCLHDCGICQFSHKTITHAQCQTRTSNIASLSVNPKGAQWDWGQGLMHDTQVLSLQCWQIMSYTLVFSQEHGHTGTGLGPLVPQKNLNATA